MVEIDSCGFYISIICYDTPLLYLLTLKNVLNTYELENAKRNTAKNVLKPPFHTAGPISLKVARARSLKNKQTDKQK